MRPFRPPLPVPPPAGSGSGTDSGADGGKGPDWAKLPGPVVCQGDPQALFGTESFAQALRQLEVYGHDGLPVLSADGGTPVAALRGRHLRPPDPQLRLAPGDRLSLLTLAPSGSFTQDPAEPDDSRPAGNATGDRA